AVDVESRLVIGLARLILGRVRRRCGGGRRLGVRGGACRVRPRPGGRREQEPREGQAASAPPPRLRPLFSLHSFLLVMPPFSLLDGATFLPAHRGCANSQARTLRRAWSKSLS